MTSIWEIKRSLGRSWLWWYDFNWGSLHTKSGQVRKKKAKQKKKQKEKQIKEQKKAPRPGNSAGDLFEMVK